jgi:hypothetical protein
MEIEMLPLVLSRLSGPQKMIGTMPRPECFEQAVVVSQPFCGLAAWANQEQKQPLSLKRMPPLPITSCGCQPTPLPVHGGIRTGYP